MAVAYFISDIHLGLQTPENERQKENRLIAFLQHIQNDANHLFILGDLFDAWIEYRTVIPKGFHRTLTALDGLTRSGISVTFLVGNHDFWTRDYFETSLGMTVRRDPFAVTLDAKKLFLHHGDGISGNDTGYRILKKILRNPLSIWLFSWLHPDIGLRLARSSSKQSREYTSHRSELTDDRGMLDFAKTEIQRGTDIVIMGHRHQPICQNIDNGIYINLGDWITYNTYAELRNGFVSLKTWE